MRTTLTPAALRVCLWTAVLGAFLLTPITSSQATAADGVTRTYDVYDFFWYSDDGGGDADAGDATTRRARSESIVSLVTNTVEPGTWAGPNAANVIQERDGRLVVTAKESVHAMLADLLRQLRETPTVQGVRLDCHFILADEAFLRAHAPAVLKRKEPGASVRGVSLLAARTILDAARDVPGVVVVPAPPLPLYSLPTSTLLGDERRLELPKLGTDQGAGVDVSRPAGLGLAVRAVADARHVTLDLTARVGTLEAADGADDGKPGAMEEVEGLYRGTFAVERPGGFLVRAPLVRAKLAGLREAADGVEVVREATAAQSDPPRYLLVVGTVRSMSNEELTLLAGPRVAKLVGERFGVDLDGAPAPPPAPGQPPAPLPPPPVRLPAQSTRVFDLRSLLLGSERGPDRAAARARRLERVMARVKEAVADDKVPLRQQYGLLIVSALEPQYDRIQAVLDQLRAERLVEPERE